MAKDRRPREPTLAEAPRDLIIEAQTRLEQVQIRLLRASPNGTWASVGPSTLRPVADLLRCEDWILELAGGGKYRVETTDPQNPAERVVPPFWVNIEGAPKPLRTARQAAAGAIPQGLPVPGYAGYPTAAPPPWAGWSGRYYGGDEDSGVDPSKFMSQTPDAIAMHQNAQLRSDLEAERREHAEERRKLADKVDELTNQLNGLVRQHSEERAQDAIRNLERRLEERDRQPVPRTQLDIVGLMAAMAPVLTAVIDSGRTRALGEREFQQKSMELQLGSVTSLLTAKKGDNDTVKMLEAITGLAIPLVTSFLDSRSPSKVAEMIATMGEAQLQSMGMVAQVLQTMMPADDTGNPWVNFAQQLLSSVESGIRQATELQTEQLGGRRPPNQHPATAVQQQSAANPMRTMSAQDIANAILNTKGIPAALTTREWYDIFVSLHSKVVPDQMAEQIADVIDRSSAAGRALPPMFVGFLDKDAPPSTALEELLQQLPVGQFEPEYCSRVCSAFDNLYDDSEGDEEQQVNGRDQRDAAPAVPREEPVFQR